VILLDASAVLALVHNETGADVVAEALGADVATISVINLAEVLEFDVRAGGATGVRLVELAELVATEPMTAADALVAAQLYPSARRPALSLADRVALATALRLNCPVLTAETAWRAPGEALGVEVRVIR
jgi:PIN domain nuclease of toxin-antitoxin system